MLGPHTAVPEPTDALWDVPIREPEERPQNSLSLGPQPGSPGTAGQGRAQEEPPGQEVFMVAQPCSTFMCTSDSAQLSRPQRKKPPLFP